MLKLGFIGAGNMAQAIAKGVISAGLTKGNNIIASCVPEDSYSLNGFKSFGAEVVHDNKQVVAKSDISILAVKPQVMKTVLEDIKDVVDNKKLFLSIAMGTTLEQIEKVLGKEAKVIRVMPNTPALVKQGASVVAPGTNATPEDIDKTLQLFKSVGVCYQASENHFDTITALSGSGPAYVFLMLEGLAAGGVRMGLPWDLAYKLAAQTMLGAASMVLETNQHPAVLRDNVTSPAGTTAEGLNELERGNFKATIISAINAATCKARSQH